VLVASSRRIRAELGWQAARDLPTMVTDAWTFAQQRSQSGTSAP
jgi:UDP-glucose 4-epimerase